MPLLLELRERNLRGGTSAQELAQVIFLLAVEDVMPGRLAQFPPAVWLNSWGVSLNPERWEADKLFQPMTPARDLSGVHRQSRSLFHFD